MKMGAWYKGLRAHIQRGETRPSPQVPADKERGVGLALHAPRRSLAVDPSSKRGGPHLLTRSPEARLGAVGLLSLGPPLREEALFMREGPGTAERLVTPPLFAYGCESCPPALVTMPLRALVALCRVPATGGSHSGADGAPPHRRLMGLLHWHPDIDDDPQWAPAVAAVPPQQGERSG